MKKALKILCVLLSLCLLCSCSKLAKDQLEEEKDDTAPDAGITEDTDDGQEVPDDTQDNGEEEEAPPPNIGTVFHTYSGYEDVLNVINGNAEIAYGVFPDEADSTDGMVTVVSSNGLTAAKHTRSTSASDGKCVFTVSGGSLYVYDETGILSRTEIFEESITVEDETEYNYTYENVQSVYITDDTLTVVTAAYSYSETYNEGSDSWVSESYDRVNVYMFDISTPDKPELTSTLAQDGMFVFSAVHNNQVYVISSWYVNSYDSDDVTTYIPHLHDTEASVAVSARDISVFEYSTCAAYTVIAGYDTETGRASASAAALGGEGRIYVDEEDIYLVFFSEATELTGSYTQEPYDVEEYSVRCLSGVIKYPMDAELAPAGEALADGCFVNDFSVWSKDGVLYLCAVMEKASYAVYTDSETGAVTRRDISAEVENVLYTLSDDLKSVKATVLPGEEIDFVRFAEKFVWVGYYSGNECFDITTGETADTAGIPDCLLKYNDELWLGISRPGEDTMTFTMYSAADFSVLCSTDLPISSNYLNSASVQIHGGLITLSATSDRQCVVAFNGENFELAAEVETYGWAHGVLTDKSLFIISDNVIGLRIEDFSRMGSFELTEQSAVG